MKQDIYTIEGALHKLKINFIGDVDFTDYIVYGSCAPFGCCKCVHFEVAEKTESGAVLIIPALNYGIYQYQLFIKQISTEVEYLILRGDIVAQDRLCDCSSTDVNDKEVITINATISADTVEVTVVIGGGQGVDGGYYIPAVSADGDLSWTATGSDMPPIATVNIKGPQGKTGAQGEQGIQGPEGPQGPQGPQGEPGSKGDTGEQGPQGEVGPAGAQGPQGIQGEQGPKGDKGDTGEQGPTGPQGETGPAGPEGPQGPVGPQGPQGEQGPTGEIDTSILENYATITYVDEAVEGAGGVFDMAAYNAFYGKYYNCTTLNEVTSINSDYKNDLTYKGEWVYDLSNLTNGNRMFYDCENLTSFSGDLSALTNGSEMFRSCENLTSWTINLPNLTNGKEMFLYCNNLTSFSADLPNLTDGSQMFLSCDNLTSFSSDLSNLTNGNDMFRNCPNLTSFSGDLSALTTGTNMFTYCLKFVSWDIPLPNLTNGTAMFSWCENLTSWTIPLPNLTSGSSMFQYCTNLTSFSGDLSALTTARYMFDRCENLTSFNSDLSALTNGEYMFGSSISTDPKLDLESVQNIANTINDLTGKTSDGTEGWGKIDIGVSSTLNGNNELKIAIQQIRDKGWTVVVL